jgi:hypothetical protein
MAQEPAGAFEPSRHRARRPAKLTSGFFVGLSLQVTEFHHGPVSLGKLAHKATERLTHIPPVNFDLRIAERVIAIGQRSGGLLWSNWGQADVGSFAAPSAAGSGARTECQASGRCAQPSLHRISPGEGVRLARQQQKRCLENLLRIVQIGQKAAAHP